MTPWASPTGRAAIRAHRRRRWEGSFVKFHKILGTWTHVRCLEPGWQKGACCRTDRPNSDVSRPSHVRFSGLPEDGRSAAAARRAAARRPAGLRPTKIRPKAPEDRVDSRRTVAHIRRPSNLGRQRDAAGPEPVFPSRFPLDSFTRNSLARTENYDGLLYAPNHHPPRNPRQERRTCCQACAVQGRHPRLPRSSPRL
jgi:hypothetical protein